MGRYEYGYKHRKEILFVVVLASLIVATYVIAYTFDTPTVSETVSTEPVLAEGAGVTGETTATVVNISANESEETEIENRSGIPEWWYWSKEDWEKFQWYANKTEVIWTYNEQGEKTGGKVMVAGEPLFKEFGTEYDKYEIAPGFKNGPSPIWYLEEGKRKGNCAIVSQICYFLFMAKGETVKLVSGKNINNGIGHGWVEYTDSKGQEWAINYDSVRTIEQQHAKYKPFDWYV